LGNDYKQYEQLQSKFEKENEVLSSLTEELEKISNKEKHINQLNGVLKEIENQIKEVDTNILKLQTRETEINNKMNTINISKLNQQEKNILALKEEIVKLNDLIKDYQKNKLTIIELKHELSLLKDLSSIFGKELVVYVFSDYISNLQALINYFIQDIVNFSLTIQLNEKGENLDIFVEDEK